MQKMISCTDLFGKKIDILAERIAFRPSVYGLIIHEGNILLCNTKSTGKYSLPGGGIDVGERVGDALHREIYEECGIEVNIEKLVGVDENCCYYNPTDEAFHVHAFFYICSPVSFELSTPDQEEMEAERPQWVPITSLKSDQFQVFGGFAVQTLSHLNR